MRWLVLCMYLFAYWCPMLDIRYYRLPFDFSVTPSLLASIEALADGWLSHVNHILLNVSSYRLFGVNVKCPV